jgi:hypothetical protein
VPAEGLAACQAAISGSQEFHSANWAARRASVCAAFETALGVQDGSSIFQLAVSPKLG